MSGNTTRMTSREIRASFLKYFESKQHRIIPSAPVIPHGDPTLLFTNAGMNQFKEIFLGTGKRKYTRVADTQKCIRVSGKHNDLEEVGRDTYHHTFFEMLGNWSFGDYYKKEAIQWAWELLTDVWKLPKHRLWATVYRTDDEAYDLWNSVTDIDHTHVLRFGEKENFWEMGETGPCGPCSEVHIDLTPGGNAGASLVNAGSSLLIEIWNLVFIQHNRTAAGELEDLPSKHVDTGMGFERVCGVMEAIKHDFQRPPSNYDSDVFLPLLTGISKISHHPYERTNNEHDVAMRVISDHIRALTFAIADGAIPSNDGRGYVLRRILRRAARFGRTLGMREPFLYQLVGTLVETMSDVFPEIREHQRHIERVIKSEEIGFNQTLDRGLELFESAIRSMRDSKIFPGDVAFKLYDTYGFPLDLTQLLCSERGLTVDSETFSRLMEEQKDRSRGHVLKAEPGSFNVKGFPVGLTVTRGIEAARKFNTTGFENSVNFIGYDVFDSEATVLERTDNLLILNTTPFYGESGGQVGDTGIISIDNTDYDVVDTQKSGNVNVHILGKTPSIVSNNVRAIVDANRRLSIMRNHSATHLLHAALRKILGTHVHQSGSLVDPEHLRFDFAHFSKVSEAELAAIEDLVNEKISEDIQLHHHRNIPFEQAKSMGALMFFGDKYGDRVNVCQFGDFSMEFCGGTHVQNTKEIGFFKFRSEGSSASGIRRVEALTHDHAIELLALQNTSHMERVEYGYTILSEIESLLRQQGMEVSTETGEPALLEKQLKHFESIPGLPASIIPAELKRAFDEQRSRIRGLEDTILKLADIKKRLEKELARRKLRSSAADIDTLVRQAPDTGGLRIVATKIDAIDIDSLKSTGDALRTKLGSGVGVLAAVLEEKVALVCVVTDDLIAQKKLSAGKIVGEVAKLLGGGGGGRPHMATAGGKDVSKLDEALQNVPSIVHSML